MPVKPVMFSGGIPSNFYPHWVRLPHPYEPGEVVGYPTNEHRFQAYKAVHSSVGTREMHDMIASAKTAGVAKSMGRDVPFDDRELRVWDGLVAPQVMLEVCIVKFDDGRLRKWLLATGSARLVEHRPDKVWGDGMDGSGKNQLGKTLELVRSIVR